MNLSRNPFSRPFPDRAFDRGTVVGYARVSVFVFVALLILQPFSGNGWRGSVLLTALGYALVTFGVSTVYGWFTARVLGWRKSGPRWTLGRWIVDCAVLLMCISVANWVFYNYTVGWRAFSPVIFVSVALSTLVIGAIPVAFSGLAIQLRAERDHQRAAGLLQVAAARRRERTAIAPAPPPRLVGLGEGDFALDPGAVLFCESRQNYVRVVYLTGGTVREETVRTTLTRVAEQLAGSAVRRCHRSYLVNTDYVRQARGNAQGLRLELVATNEIVPVSRAYVAAMRRLG